MFILGINAYHGDASACLLQDGKLIAAAEEERFRRIKHWAGFPSEAIRYCLQAVGIELRDVEHIAINRDPRANFWRKVLYTLTKRPELKLVLERLRNAQQWRGVEEKLQETFPQQSFRGKLHHIEHHLAHLSSAFHVSPFNNAVVVSVDGFGDFASAAWGIGQDTQITVADKVYFPHSLGIFYQAITQYLGFPHYGDEYKVMGLAPYGKPLFMEEMRHIVDLQDNGGFRLNLAFFRHAREKVAYEWNDCAPTVGNLYTPQLENLLGKAREKDEPLNDKHKNIAHSAQAMYEEAFFHLLNILYARYQVENLCLSGGCAMNSVANGKVYQRTPFKRVYVQAAAGDAGGAIGAAFVVWHQVSRAPRAFVMEHAYWGPAFSQTEIERLLTEKQAELVEAHCTLQWIGETTVLCEKTARAIAEGKVVGWFQGAMEWGPRALGNRSIVCDPRRADMKDLLNAKIKRRESFRPFAPSILREHVAQWFETDDDVPFMMQVFQICADKRQLIPAVTHVDGSGRLQTVSQHTNHLYHQLITAFHALTGIPLVLNTSFNENEPVVCRPEEALDCFLRTRMDVLVLGNYLLVRTD